MLAYSGGGRVVAEHVDLDALVKEMVDLLGASVARHCTLTYNSPGPLPLVETDPTQIRQVVLNLIVNAAEAVDDHGVITVETGVRDARPRDAEADDVRRTTSSPAATCSSTWSTTASA